MCEFNRICNLGWKNCKMPELRKRIFKLEKALDRLARLGNEPVLGNSEGNIIAQKALEKNEE